MGRDRADAMSAGSRPVIPVPPAARPRAGALDPRQQAQALWLQQRELSRQKRIHFVPWEGRDTEFARKAENWRKLAIAAGKRFDVVIYDREPSRLLQQLAGADDQIYIHGHGSVAKDLITGGNGAGPGLSARDVIERLQRAGLSLYFKGKIKCWSCHSAEAGQPIYLKVGGWTGLAFAQKLVDLMHYGDGNGLAPSYTGCAIYGYLGMVASIPGPDGHRQTAEPLKKIGEEYFLESRSHARHVGGPPDVYKVRGQQETPYVGRGRASGTSNEANTLGEPNRKLMTAVQRLPPARQGVQLGARGGRGSG